MKSATASRRSKSASSPIHPCQSGSARTLIERLERRQLLSAAISSAIGYGADQGIMVPVGGINPVAAGVALGQAGTHLTITPTFDSTITSDPNAATIENTINAAIAVYENQFSTPITVTITFQEVTSGLGQSLKYFGAVPYSSYLTQLQSTATTADDTTALAHLPAGSANPVNGNASIDATLPQLRTLGFSASPPSGQTDGTIGVNVSLCNLTRTSINPGKYDLMAVVSHEIDEVLAFGSALNNLSNGAPTPTGAVWGEDLYRYDQNGARSLSTSASAQAFLSIDGPTQIARFNQTAGGDFSDWYSPGGQTPQVQDAFGTAGSTPNLGVELRALDVLGYTPITTTHQAPVAGNDVATTNVNTAVLINELSNDTASGATLDATSVHIATAAGHGSTGVDPVTGKITYTPASNYVGPDSFTYTVKDSLGATSNAAMVSVTVNPVATYGGTPFPGPAAAVVPGTIQAENFDNGGEGVAYHDLDTANQGGANYRPGAGVDLQTTTDTGGGYQVGYVNAGEWLKYSVNVQTRGTYSLDVRAANRSPGGQMNFEVDGVNVTGLVNVPNTGSWTNYQIFTISNISLSAGPHVVRVLMDTNSSNGFVGNFNWFRFNLTQAAPNGPTVSAGANQSVNYPFPVTLSGSVTETNPPGALTSTWSQKSGPGTTTFGNSASASTTAKFSAPGTYVLQLAGSDGSITNTASVTITVNPDPGPVVNAGSNQTITLPATAALNGSVTQSPLPPNATLTSTWSQKSGPGTTSFGNANSLSTTASFTQSGTYVLQLTGSDGITANSATVTITVNPAAAPGPVVNAGSNQSINYPFAVSLNGSVTESNPPGPLTSTWTLVPNFGPGTVTFANANNPVTTATFSQPGIYTLQLAGSDGTFTNKATVQITVNPDPGPTVSAGSNQTITLPNSAPLNGSVTQSPLAPGLTLTSSWTKVSGPGTASFANANSAGTTASFSLAGSYVLQLSGGNGITTHTSQVTITVNPASTYGGTPFGGTQAPVPGLIQAENFDNGGEGVAYHWQTTSNPGGSNYRPGVGVGIQTTTDSGGGNNICYAVAGDWLKYTVNVATTRAYSLQLRVAQKAAGGQMHVEVDGVNVTGLINIPNTGSWNTWQTISVSGINLTAGPHVVKVSFDTNANDNPGVANAQFVANLNWLQFV